jgi:hypothetical protein
MRPPRGPCMRPAVSHEGILLASEIRDWIG